MGSTTFILFDNGVEKIIPKTAKELAEMQDEVIMNSKFLIKSIIILYLLITLYSICTEFE